MTTDRITPELLQAGTDAMHGLAAMQDRMLPLIDEINLIVQNGIVQLKALDLMEAVQTRNRIVELGHKGRSWTGR